MFTHFLFKIMERNFFGEGVSSPFFNIKFGLKVKGACFILYFTINLIKVKSVVLIIFNFIDNYHYDSLYILNLSSLLVLNEKYIFLVKTEKDISVIVEHKSIYKKVSICKEQ